MTRARSASLFPTEEPLARAQMIGRENDVQELVTQLTAGVHRIVAGPRRTGKSSVCTAVVAELGERDFYTVSVSLFSLVDSAALARGLAQGALANRDALRKLIRRTRETANAVLRGAALSLVLRAKSELGEAVEIAFDPAAVSRRDAVEAIAAALRLCDQIAEQDDRQLILFVDEMQELASPRAPYGDPDALLGQMRELLHGMPRITCLFAGSIEHVIRDVFTGSRRPMAGFGGFHELEPITGAQWQEGIAARFQEDGCTASDQALAHIIEAGEGHPRSTMLVAQQTHVAAVEEDTHTLDLILAERGFRSAMLAEQARHIDLVDRIRAMGAAPLRVSQRLAAGERPYRAGVEAKAVTRALDALALAGIANRGHAGWQISDPLLARYIREALKN